jgi:hypothetical protein
MVIMNGLYKRKDKSQFYDVRRVIPARFRHLMSGKTELKVSLGTADRDEALSKTPLRDSQLQTPLIKQSDNSKPSRRLPMQTLNY